MSAVARDEDDEGAPTSKVVSMTERSGRYDADPDRQVILVEDDSDLLYIGTKRLRAAGFEPIPAANGREAIERMAENPRCRRMVTDFNMPTLGGDAWIRYLEENHGDWMIVVMSSDDIDSGPFICVPKPVDFENLLQAFHRETRE